MPLQQTARFRGSDAQERQVVWLLRLPHQGKCPWSVGTVGMGCSHHKAGRPCARSRCPPGCRPLAQAHLYTREDSCERTYTSQASAISGSHGILDAGMQHKRICAHCGMQVDADSSCWQLTELGTEQRLALLVFFMLARWRASMPGGAPAHVCPDCDELDALASNSPLWPSKGDRWLGVGFLGLQQSCSPSLILMWPKAAKISANEFLKKGCMGPSWHFSWRFKCSVLSCCFSEALIAWNSSV